MDPYIIALITIGLLIVAVLSGLYIGIGLGLISLIGLWLISGDFKIALDMIGSTAYRGIMEYVFGTVPLFVLMGKYADLSGAGEDLYDAASVVFRRVRGGLGITTVIANAIFAAMTGVSIASAAIFSQIAVPQMLRLGYKREFALGTVAASSILGMLIPPSLLFIIYGILTEEGIGTLFIAGVLPGILLTGFLCVQVLLVAKFLPHWAKDLTLAHQKLGLGRSLGIVFKPWPVLILVALVLGGIYGGFFTPTEAGAAGAFGTFLFCIARRKLTVNGAWRSLVETGYTMAAVLLVVLCAQMYSRMLTISGLPGVITDFALNVALPPMVVVLLFLLILLFLGCILDSTSILMVTMPLMAPVVESLGFNLIWFGVVAVVTIEIGIITPPFGMIVFAMKATLGDQATIEEIFRGCFPFLVVLFIVLIFLIIFPQISLFLPELMLKR